MNGNFRYGSNVKSKLNAAGNVKTIVGYMNIPTRKRLFADLAQIYSFETGEPKDKPEDDQTKV